jgi:BirA family biotin operon repressor/biotin-[acetyl-CoA-carboxylase] ligase
MILPMNEPHTLHWNAEALWQQLEPQLPGLSVEVVARISSTNSALLERARVVAERATDGDVALVRRSVESSAFGRRSADLQPCLLVAEHQTAGRGRQGRSWQSAPGASLTFSLALPLAPSDWSGLSLAVGAALADALDPASANEARLGVKWPNDLWLMDSGIAGGSGRKLGGILIETVAAGAHRLAVIGIGLNILPLEAAQATTGVACVQELDPQASAPQVLARVAPALVQALQRFERDGFAAFADAFAARDILAGRAVTTTHPQMPDGIANGVAADGSLRLRTPQGVRLVTSGEVSVRLDAGADPSC